jgi:hypothetical protein
VTVFSGGATNYLAEKELRITPAGIRSLPSRSEVDTRTQLRSMQTDFDEVPVLGWLARSVALRQHDKHLPQATWIAESKASSRISRQMDFEVQRQLEVAQQQLEESVLQPLRSLQLNPQATDMKTTETEQMAPGRLAGAAQWGAHTPRPRPPQDAEASLQIHESAINNLLGGLQLENRGDVMDRLAADIARQLGATQWKTPVEMQRRVVYVQFAAESPARVEIVDDLVRLKLRFSELDAGGDTFYYDFDVTVEYKPVIEGLQVALQREGRVVLDGAELGIRDVVELQAIFNRVFRASKRLPLIDAKFAQQPAFQGMQVTQCVLSSGWLGLAASRPVGAVAGRHKTNRR